MLVYIFMLKGEVSAPDASGRVAITLSEGNRDFVLAEMRGFLVTVQQINQGLAENNPDKIIKAAQVSGHATTEKVPTSLMKALPVGFKSLGMDTHHQFDEIARAVQERYQPQEVQQRLSKVLNNCISCHSAYKFEIQHD